MKIRELKRKLIKVEKHALREAEQSKKIKLSLKKLQDNMVLKIIEAEANTKLRLMNIELRIQELNDHLNSHALAPANDDEVEEDPEEVLEVEEETEEEVDVEDNFCRTYLLESRFRIFLFNNRVLLYNVQYF
ncbi:hypothetical protein ACH5RR_029161 [Cinchona calisaya]|uniref:Uncharacterized protein n=1 Tax=Cinchona calisaya TaxID=153742 RepID=A0ABD2YUF1_9GENT